MDREKNAIDRLQKQQEVDYRWCDDVLCFFLKINFSKSEFL